MKRMLFVTGYSRSGTKIISNLLESNEPKNHTYFGELHFFGRIALTGFEPVKCDKHFVEIVRRLSEQFLKRKNCPFKNQKEIISLIEKADHPLPCTTFQVYSYFITTICDHFETEVAIDGTPRNSYYMKEILCQDPSAKILMMSRDPFACILSQQEKWKKYFRNRSYQEALRLYVNYNPFVLGLFWSNVHKNFLEYMDHENCKLIRFHELINKPIETLRGVKEFLDLKSEIDSREIKSGDEIGYQEKLNSIDRNLALHACGQVANEFGYCYKKSKYALIVLLFGIPYLIKIPIALLLNRKRFQRGRHEIKKRML